MAASWEHLMANYGRQHRHAFNIALHLVFVPTILATSWVPFAFVPLTGRLTLAEPIAILMWIGWFRLDRGFALAALPMVIGGLAGTHALAALGWPTGAWWALGLWVAGWIAQFVGHAIEGRRPALVGDGVVALYSAPLFVAAELCRFAGLRREFFARVDARIAQIDASMQAQAS